MRINIPNPVLVILILKQHIIPLHIFPKIKILGEKVRKHAFCQENKVRFKKPSAPIGAGEVKLEIMTERRQAERQGNRKFSLQKEALFFFYKFPPLFWAANG